MKAGVSRLILAAEVDGRLWSVGGSPLVIPDGLDGAGLVLAQVGAQLTGPGPWRVSVRYSGMAFELVVSPDGSVDAAAGTELTPHVRMWIRPPGSMPVFPVARLPEDASEFRSDVHVVSAHPGSGASTWAQLLRVPERIIVSPPDGARVVVLRSTLAGVEAAKQYSSTAAALLVVADAPGRTSPAVSRALRVLGGAAPVVRAPWIPALRGVVSAPAGTESIKAVAKVAAAIRNTRRTS